MRNIWWSRYLIKLLWMEKALSVFETKKLRWNTQGIYLKKVKFAHWKIFETIISWKKARNLKYKKFCFIVNITQIHLQHFLAPSLAPLSDNVSPNYSPQTPLLPHSPSLAYPSQIICQATFKRANINLPYDATHENVNQGNL